MPPAAGELQRKPMAPRRGAERQGEQAGDDRGDDGNRQARAERRKKIGVEDVGHVARACQHTEQQRHHESCAREQHSRVEDLQSPMSAIGTRHGRSTGRPWRAGGVNVQFSTMVIDRQIASWMSASHAARVKSSSIFSAS